MKTDLQLLKNIMENTIENAAKFWSKYQFDNLKQLAVISNDNLNDLINSF